MHRFQIAAFLLHSHDFLLLLFVCFDSVDGLTIPSRRGKGELRRIPEVFDCWFESGSMPYAQVHYPFENRREFEDTFPADFIAEGIDQTRGWCGVTHQLYNTPRHGNPFDLHTSLYSG